MANYIVKKIENKQEWEAFLKKQEHNIFVQSYPYLEFNQLLGNYTFILGVYNYIDGEKNLIAGSLVTEIHAKRGNFFYLPYGPIIDFDNTPLLQAFFTELKDQARHRRVDFIRISPFHPSSKAVEKTLKEFGLRKAPMHMIAEHTSILDLEQDEVDILKNMNQNHRNLIRRAVREGVEIKESQEIGDVKILHDLLKVTANKHKFVPYSLDYIEKEFKVFQNRNEAKLYFAYHNKILLGAIMVIFKGNTAVYRHGASAEIKTKIPFSYALQWHALKEAKFRKLKYYNFWGIAPQNAKKSHPFYGITHFKNGFGGFNLNLSPAFDFPLTKKYWLNYIVETFRKFKRGF